MESRIVRHDLLRLRPGDWLKFDERGRGDDQTPYVTIWHAGCSAPAEVLLLVAGTCIEVEELPEGGR